MLRKSTIWKLPLLAGLLVVQSACGSESLNSRILVVYARNSRDSEAVARYYAHARHIPAAHLCAIKLPNPDAVLLSAEDYERNVKTPVGDCIESAGTEKILYIVLAYLRPFRVDPGGLHNYALDSYLADTWDFS